jgi:hypothetical protein
VGYGPARALLPEDIVAVDAYLSSLTEDELRRRYDPARMMKLKIYPEIWTEADEDEELEYVLDAFRTLREFVTAAREAGAALVVYVN